MRDSQGIALQSLAKHQADLLRHRMDLLNEPAEGVFRYRAAARVIVTTYESVGLETRLLLNQPVSRFPPD